MIALALSIAPVLFVWVWTWRHLATSWQAYPHYEYGWGVPVLFLVLVWQNWPGDARPPKRPSAAALAAAAGVVVWILGEIIRQHDPIWRLADGLLTSGATLLSAAWLLSAGGWPLVCRQIYPLLFAWTAMPWPMPLELGVTQHLLQFVTSGAMVCISAVGGAALQHGNVIELLDGPIGVDEACSGIQSLQAAIMAALFLGGFYRLAPVRRAGLLASACVIAVLGNLLRVLALVGYGARVGVANAASMHDQIGTAATIATFLSILGLARTLRSGNFCAASKLPPLELPSPACGVVILGLLGGSAYAFGFANRARDLVVAPHWRIDANRLPDDWRAERFEPTRKERALLRFTAYDALKFQMPEGRLVWLYRFEWAPGEGMPPLAFSHTPAMCMPWIGWTLASVPRTESIQLKSGALPAVVFDFVRGSERLVAIQLVSAAGLPVPFTAFIPNSGNRARRLATMVTAPHANLDEEILLYIPAPGGKDDGLSAAQQVLDAVLSSGI